MEEVIAMLHRHRGATIVSFVLLAMASLAPLPATAAEPGVFMDVPPTHTFYEEVMWLKEAGITRGCNPPDNTMFCPTGPVTRGEMAAFLFRGVNIDEPPPPPTIPAMTSSLEMVTMPPYSVFQWVSFVTLVENTGTADLTDVSVTVLGYGDSGAPAYVRGDSDTVLEPGEIWSYPCESPLQDPMVAVRVEARAPAGGDLTSTVEKTDFTLADPVEITVAPSATSVGAGDTVDWAVTVTNVGTEGLAGVRVDGRAIEANDPGPWPFFDLGPPVEVAGNGDALLDPLEVWTWTAQTVVDANVSYQVDLSCKPWYESGIGGYVFSAVSGTVSVTP